MKNKFIIILLLILLSIAGYFYFSNNRSTIRKELSDFAVDDTGAITKIFLVDNEKKSVLLERINQQSWKANGKYEARQDAVNVLLTTIKRVTVKTPVPKSAFENVVKQIASTHVKTEIYLAGDDEPIKSYYVGHNNPEHSGTYMLLENSTVPFLMHVEGFRGFLSPRYFTNENEWRSTAIFQYGYGEIASIRLEYPSRPEFSFVISESGSDHFAVKSLATGVSVPADTTSVLHYVSLFRKVHFEGFEETKSREFTDSLIRTMPMHNFTVTDKTGTKKKLKTFPKPGREGAVDMDGKPINYDLDRFYGLIDDRDFVVLQYFVFDPLLKKTDDFYLPAGK